MTVIAVRHDASLVGRVVARCELHYASGGDARRDLSPHVRAGSGLAWLGSGDGARLVVAQDDTSYLALLDPRTGAAEPLALDHAVAGRRLFEARLGNKKHKLDLEACARLPDGRVLVVGSGSLPIRERLVVVDDVGVARVVVDDVGVARVVDASALYAALRARVDFAGSEMNVEGATVLGDHLVLLNRGNGAASGALVPVDALAEIELAPFVAYLDGGPVPPIERVSHVELGAHRGVRLTWTDACARGGRVWFLCAAEASPNAIDDGEVAGTAIGVLEPGLRTARLGSLVDEAGAPLRAKVEGLAWARADGAGDRALVVVDRDDPDQATELLHVDLDGSGTAAG